MYSHSYATVTTLGDFGPWISKIILDLPREVRTSDIDPGAFSVFCARRKHDGSILMRKERGASEALPSQGYIPSPQPIPATIVAIAFPRGPMSHSRSARNASPNASRVASWALNISTTTSR